MEFLNRIKLQISRLNYHVILVFIFSFAYIISSLYSHQYVGLNDFWGNLFIANNLSIANPESLYNGFYPIGYNFTLKLLSIFNPIIGAALLNISFGILLLILSQSIYKRFLSEKFSTACFILLFFNSLIFQYIITPSSDIGCALFAIAGIYCYLKGLLPSQTKMAVNYILLSGVWFGLAGLWRHHGLIIGFFFLSFFFLFFKQARKQTIGALFLLGLVYSIQITINLASGHGLLETAQYFNAFKLMYPVNWWDVPTNIPKSFLKILSSDPQLFFKNYFLFFFRYIYLLVPFLISWLLLRDPLHKKVNRALSLTVLFYSLLVCIGGSIRGFLPIIPLSLFSSFLLIQELNRRFKNSPYFKPSKIGFILIFGLVSLKWISHNYNLLIHNNNQFHNFKNIEISLLENEKVSNPLKVFSLDFDFYFPNTPPYQPYTAGGWANINLYNYENIYPKLSNKNLEIFLIDCKEAGISHLIISPKSNNFIPKLDPIYNQTTIHPNLFFIKKFNRLKLFTLK